MNPVHRLFTVFLLAVSVAAGQVHAQPQQQRQPNKLEKFLRWGGEYLDKMARRHIDSLYIELPKERWRVMGEGSFELVSLTMTHERSNRFCVLGLVPNVTTGFKPAAGGRLAYRTLSAGYRFKFGGRGKGDFSIGSNGNRFAVNLLVRNMESSSPSTRVYILSGPDAVSDVPPYDEMHNITLNSPMRFNVMLLDGFYIFNSRHYSNAATHSLAFIQRKSAGGFLLGASWLRFDSDYADGSNWRYISMVNKVGRYTLNQVNICAGYGFNWVPHRDWVINYTVMPQLTVFNQLEFYYYDGKILGDEFELYPETQLTLAKKDRAIGNIKVNWMSRLAVVYNHRRFVACASAQFKHFRYSHTGDYPEAIISESVKIKGVIYDLTGGVAIGWRF